MMLDYSPNGILLTSDFETSTPDSLLVENEASWEENPLSKIYPYPAFALWKSTIVFEGPTEIIYSNVFGTLGLDKYTKLCKKHFDYTDGLWRQRSPHKIQSFLRDWTGNDSISLVMTSEYSNPSIEDSLWRFDYVFNEKEGASIPLQREEQTQKQLCESLTAEMLKDFYD